MPSRGSLGFPPIDKWDNPHNTLRTMSTQTTVLLKGIDAYLRANPGITETTLGRLAVNDGKFVARLRKGGRCWPETEALVNSFMAANKYPVLRRKVAA